MRRRSTPAGSEPQHPLVDRFGILLALTVAALFVLSLVDMRSSALAAAIVQSTVVLVLVLALFASGMRARRRRILVWLLLFGMFASLAPATIDAIWPDSIHADVPRSFSPLALFAGLIAPVLITRRVMQHRRVQVATVLGIICSYLLIAISFALIFLAIDEYQPAAFFDGPEPTTTFFYFSLVTIATLGYGDYTAVSAGGHLVSAMEAVIGQVFLVTFVAMIVGRLVSENPGRVESLDAEQPAEASRDA